MIKIAVINESTVVADAAVQACVNALQVQVWRDFAPVWGIDAQLNFHPSKIAPAGAWQLVILDDSDQADALGYHELTSGGLPLGKVFAKSDLTAGTSWTVTASHELLEMLVDPDCNDCAEWDRADGSTWFFAYEVCDAVEADALGYQIDGVLVSNFVTPAWFLSQSLPVPLDFRGDVKAPFTLAPGGYISIFEVGAGVVAGWQQVTSDYKPGGPSAPIGSRRVRRAMPDRDWRRSNPNHRWRRGL